ncbi:NaCP60E [Symbiodinium sp. KB8]|nr:NaCP60E [Symbiodinium sp. KB8]
MRLPQEREPQDGARYQVLMQATFGHDGQQAKDAANLELASTAIKQDDDPLRMYCSIVLNSCSLVMSLWVDLQAEEVKQSSRVLKELDLILQRAGQVQEKQWIETRQAEILIAVTITVYAFFIGFELEIEANHADVASTLSQAFLICHVVFNTVFVLEIVLRVRSVGIRYCSPFNPAGFFDAVIILIGTVENIVSVVFAMMSQDGSGSVLAIAGVMRIVRLLRLARLLRGFLVCQELRLLVTGMMLALPTVVWAGVLFAIVVYLGTMFTVILLGNIPELEGYFGTIGLALWTHFVIVTMETWPDIADTVLAVASPLWGVYFVVFICISSMSLMNLVTGVIAEKLLSTKDVTTSEDTEDEMEAFRQEKAAFKQDVCELLLYEDDIDVDIFAGLMETIKMRAWLQKLQVSPELPANDLFNLLDTECNGNLTLDQLVEGMLNLRGSRLRVHSLLLQQDLRRYCQDELDALAEVETIVVRQISKNLTSLNQTFQEELQNMQKLAEPISTAPGCDDNFSAWMAEKESLERLAMAAYGPPIAGPVTFEMATPETTSCPQAWQVVTTFPWPGEVNVKCECLEDSQLHQLKLHVSVVAAFIFPAARFLLLFFPSFAYDLKLDFCVKWPSPKATTWLHDDRFLQVVFNAAVNLNGTSRRIQLRAGPEADAIPEGGPGQEAPERVTALFTLQPSKRLYWMYGDGNFTSGVGTVEDNMDGTGSLLEQPAAPSDGPVSSNHLVYCTHAAGIQTCEDHRSFEVDICEVEGNCPDKEKLPCGMWILEADFQAGMAISRGVVSRTMTQTHHTRGCHPPELVKTLRFAARGFEFDLIRQQARAMKLVFEAAYLYAALVHVFAGFGKDEWRWKDSFLLVVSAGRGPTSHVEPVPCQGANALHPRRNGFLVIIGVIIVVLTFVMPSSILEWHVDNVHYRLWNGRLAIGDPAVTPCIAGPASCSEWSVDLQRALASKGPRRKPMLRWNILRRAPLWLLMRAPGQTDLQSELNPGLVLPGAVNFMIKCLLVHDGLLLDKGCSAFVRLGIHYAGWVVPRAGHFNRRALHDVFGFNLQHAHSGNVQYLQDGHRSVAPQCSDKWLKMLPVLNAMTAVKLPPRGQAFGHTVTATGLYSAQETSSSFNSFGLVDLQLGGGKAAYFAFDWHDDVPQERRAWAITFAMLAGCNEDQVEVSDVPVDSRARGWQAPAPRMHKVSYERSESAGMPYQSMQLGPGNRQVPNPGKHRAEASWPRRLQEEGQALDAWEEASLTGDPVEPDLEVSIALTCPFRPDSSDRLEFPCRNFWAACRPCIIASKLTAWASAFRTML